MRGGLLTTIRRLQTILTIIVFVLVTIICWTITDYDIRNIELSKWGSAKESTYYLWNGGLILISFGIIFNTTVWIYRHPRLIQKNLLQVMFILSGLCLTMVGAFPVKYGYIHAFFAFAYFFAYPLSVFVLAFINRNYIEYNEWLTHLGISIIMMILPLVFVKLYDGKAVAEIVHSIVVMFWHATLLKKRIKIKQTKHTDNESKIG